MFQVTKYMDMDRGFNEVLRQSVMHYLNSGFKLPYQRPPMKLRHKK
jgi:chromosome condensin MukBEF complex kleisin-like MukF subunit